MTRDRLDGHDPAARVHELSIQCVIRRGAGPIDARKRIPLQGSLTLFQIEAYFPSPSSGSRTALR